MAGERRKPTKGLESIPIRPSGVVVHSYCQNLAPFPSTWAIASSDHKPFEAMFHRLTGIAVRSVRSVRSAP